MRGPVRNLVTEEEFLALPVSNQKIELVDGEVILPPHPTFVHQEVLVRIVEALRAWARTQPGPVTVAQSPLDVRSARGRILQPDAMVFLARIPRDHKGPIDRIPELCIEVLSEDRVYDRVTKRLLYGAAGVSEYWVVEQSGTIERRSGAGLDRAEELRDTLETPLLPGFSLDLRKLFAID